MGQTPSVLQWCSTATGELTSNERGKKRVVISEKRGLKERHCWAWVHLTILKKWKNQIQKNKIKFTFDGVWPYSNNRAISVNYNTLMTKNTADSWFSLNRAVRSSSQSKTNGQELSKIVTSVPRKKGKLSLAHLEFVLQKYMNDQRNLKII